jgi:hypothetical protein
MSLKDWEERNRWLTPHTPTKREIRDLLSGAEQDLRESAAEGLGPDWRMTIAYNALLRSANAALAASGYRVSRSTDYHHVVIQSLALTVVMDGEQYQAGRPVQKEAQPGWIRTCGSRLERRSE